MPLELREIEPGAVAYFDHNVLLSRGDIDRNDDGLDRPGPFVCVLAYNGSSVWCALTRQQRPERIEILAAWRSDGSENWRQKPTYLVDGLNTYVGPNEAFVAAAAAERPFAPLRRPRVAKPGVDAVLKEIDRQGGPLLK